MGTPTRADGGLSTAYMRELSLIPHEDRNLPLFGATVTEVKVDTMSGQTSSVISQVSGPNFGILALR